MKTALFCLILGAILGVVGWRYYERTQNPTLADRTEKISDLARDKATQLKDKVVEDSKTVGERAGDVRLIGTIKAKYLLDKDLSVLAITVDCEDGNVVLTGTAATTTLVARAVNLARNTDGVRAVSNRLTVKP